MTTSSRMAANARASSSRNPGRSSSFPPSLIKRIDRLPRPSPETAGLLEAEHDVHILHGLAGCALDKVVDRRGENERLVDLTQADRTAVRVIDVPQCGRVTAREN